MRYVDRSQDDWGTDAGDFGAQAFARVSAGEPRQGPAAGSVPDDGRLAEERLFRAFGIGKPVIAAARTRSLRNGTSIEAELIADGSVAPGIYYEVLARVLGLPFLRHIDANRVAATHHLDAALADPRFLKIEDQGRSVICLAPEARDIAWLERTVRSRPSLAHSLAVAAPATIRTAAWASGSRQRARQSVRALFEADDACSARIVMTGRQGFTLGAAIASLAGLAALAPVAILAALHVVLSAFFFSGILLRLLALCTWRRVDRIAELDPDASDLPVYSVVVALHDEAAIVPQLVKALSRLRWPRSLLDIKLICEADDAATLAALARIDLPPSFEVVSVPAMEPRTKPKALHYALAGVRGAYLAIYDAEDWPNPDQLLEAYAAFTRLPERTAYLQAPLVITNARENWLSANFALEYAGLFRGLLPFLARFGLPLPLGGTSNHFRVPALRECGAWDPHNVTEDADLGIRLYRRGYRGGVLHRATLEAAPEDIGVWMRQRTRWFKGWMQTWLVTMRSPRRLHREMGFVGFVVYQVLILGMVVSALGHPLLVGFAVTALARLLGHGSRLRGGLDHALFAVDTFNFVAGYATFILLGTRVMISEERRRLGTGWRWVPAYWLAMSAAAWRALAELKRNPFYWAKTPHGPKRAAGSAAICAASTKQRDEQSP